MNSLDDEIDFLEKKIHELTERLTILKTERSLDLKLQEKIYKYDQLMINDPIVNKIVAFISDNPGCDKKAISQLFPGLNGRKLTDILTKARRNRDLIENRGTRMRPKWFAK